LWQPHLRHDQRGPSMLVRPIEYILKPCQERIGKLTCIMNRFLQDILQLLIVGVPYPRLVRGGAEFGQSKRGASHSFWFRFRWWARLRVLGSWIWMRMPAVHRGRRFSRHGCKVMSQRHKGKGGTCLPLIKMFSCMRRFDSVSQQQKQLHGEKRRGIPAEEHCRFCVLEAVKKDK